MLKYRHLLSEEYSHIVPLPCALHVANLLTKDICRLEGMTDIVKGNCKMMNFFMKSNKWFHASQEWAKKNKNNKYSFQSLCETHWYSMCKVSMSIAYYQAFLEYSASVQGTLDKYPKIHSPALQFLLKSELSRTYRQTFRPRFRWEMLIHIWISPRHWKDASGEKRSLGSDTLYVFLCLETQVYKYIYVIVDHWFFWVTG